MTKRPNMPGGRNRARAMLHLGKPEDSIVNTLLQKFGLNTKQAKDAIRAAKKHPLYSTPHEADSEEYSRRMK